jgi:hypothetical protein
MSLLLVAGVALNVTDRVRACLEGELPPAAGAGM